LKSFYISFLVGLLLAGCSGPDVNTFNKHEEGKSIVIALVGKGPVFSLNKVEFIQVKLDTLLDSNKSFDALFIMEDTFNNTLSLKYKDIYKNLPFPVIFIGLNKPLENFIELDYNYNDFPSSTSHTFAQAFYKTKDGTKHYWRYVPSTPPQNDGDFEKIYYDILKTIDNFVR
jgi:hypothetical protein